MLEKDLFEESEVQLTKKGLVRKRKPKKKNVYFTEETEEAILEYRSCETKEEKDEIYNKKIHFAFYKLCENIIHTFKFYYLDTESIEDLKYEVISFLLQKLNLYEQSKGKAYSYFGTIAKRYLIIYNQKNYKKTVAKVEMEEIDNEEKTIEKLIDKDEPEQLNMSPIVEDLIQYVELNMYELFSSNNEIQVVECILELFKKREKIEIFNKKILFIYIKEMVEVPTSTITKVIKTLKNCYKLILQQHIKKMNG